MYRRNQYIRLLIILFVGWGNHGFIHPETRVDAASDSGFTAGINCPIAYVYENPQENSSIVDSLNDTESFVAYGHRDSSFCYIKRIRPEEVLTDSGYVRSYKTIYGYVKQSELMHKTDEELLCLPEYLAINRCKKGLIDDVDGFVNVRIGRSINSEIIGHILKKEDFWYWILPSGNWHIVQTATGIRGFVYKDRVKENRPQFRNYQLPKNR